MSELDQQAKMNQGKSIAQIIEDAISGIQSAINEIGDIEAIQHFDTEDADLIKKKNILVRITEELKD